MEDRGSNFDDEQRPAEYCGGSRAHSCPPVTPSPRHPVILYPLSGAAFLILLCCFLFFYRLADRDLWSSHEGRAAQDAQTILDDGRWGLLRLYDRNVELQKPPLYYWLVALTARLRGGVVD